MAGDSVLGWDLGGAHLKAVLVDERGAAAFALELPCPLWEGLTHLHQAVDTTLTRLPFVPGRHAVTMSGELADCFPDRETGVTTLAGYMADRLPQDRLRFFAGANGFVGASALPQAAAQVASANWLATARYVANLLDAALVVDVGSTTADVVPVLGGAVRARGTDDHSRLACDELVYTGIARTPLMALASRVPFQGSWVNVTAEHFATTADIYRLTGELPDGADLLPTTDGGVKSPEGSARRLARMIGRDAVSAPLSAWKMLAACFAERQIARLWDACAAVLSRGNLPAGAPIVGAGVGSFVAVRLAPRLARPYLALSSLAPLAGAHADEVAACAPAFAVASLLRMSDAGPTR